MSHNTSTHNHKEINGNTKEMVGKKGGKKVTWGAHGHPINEGGSSPHNSMVKNDTEIKIANLLCLIIFIILNLCVVAINLREHFYVQKPKSERCILPHYDLEDDPPEENECVIYTHCEFKQNGTDEVNRSKYYLNSDEILFLPKDYRTENQGYKCPIYWELPGYKIRLDNSCDDKGFGCCRSPIDTYCSTIMHWHNDMNYAGFLYNKEISQGPKYLNIPKTDLHGSNCPTIQEIICESFHSPLYYTYYLTITNLWLISAIIMLCLACHPNTTRCIFKKPAVYYHVSESV